MNVWLAAAFFVGAAAVWQVRGISVTPGAYESQFEAASAWRPTWPSQKPGKVIFLTSKEDLDERMDRFFYDLFEAAKAHPQIRAELWGPGFAGFVNNISLTDNVVSHYNACKDVAFLYVHTGNDDPRTGKKMGWDWHGHRNCLLIEELGDCHAGECIHASIAASNITVVRYAFQALHNFYPQHYGNAKLYAHNPDCADPAKIKPVPWKDKKDVAMLFGNLSPHLYPIRALVASGIENGTIPAQVYHHPGYAGNADIYPDYISALQHAKICIFDSSVVKKAIRKFMEAFMAGCVVASDLPHEMHTLIKDKIIVLEDADDATVVADKLRRALADQEMLRNKAANSLQVAMSHWTCTHKFSRLLDFTEQYNGGLRGYLFPYSFTVGCNRFLANDKRAPWCS